VFSILDTYRDRRGGGYICTPRLRLYRLPATRQATDHRIPYSAQLLKALKCTRFICEQNRSNNILLNVSSHPDVTFLSPYVLYLFLWRDLASFPCDNSYGADGISTRMNMPTWGIPASVHLPIFSSSLNPHFAHVFATYSCA
jgi:hypothetical protein